MKLFAVTLLSSVLFASTSTNLLADPIQATLHAGLATETLVETPILNGEQFTYEHLTTSGLNTADTTLVATYVNTLGTLGVFNITDICAKVTILGPAAPCQQLAFSLTDATFGDTSLIAAVGANVNLAGNVADVNFDGSVALGGATVDFSGPPVGDGPTPAPVPEPGTLSLMATGLLTAAGALRRKLKS